MRRNGFPLLSKSQRQVIVILLLAFFLLPALSVDAAPSRPIVTTSDWRTGELEVCWTGVTDARTGYAMRLYVATHETDGAYELYESWPIYEGDEAGCYISKYHFNGQSIWYYVQVHDVLTGEVSERSNIYKQTPPITAYIINWPDMFKDLIDALEKSNKDMQDFLEGLVTPSDQAMQDLQDAINGLKDAVGAGQAGNSGNQIQDGFDGVQNGMRPPIGVDDGDGTFTGGNSGSNLPSDNQTIGDGDLNLNVPNPDSGTPNEMTIRIPYMVDMQGQLVYMQLFTDEQMEKMKWLNLIRTLAGAIIFIMFGIWLVSRFSPQLKS